MSLFGLQNGLPQTESLLLLSGANDVLTSTGPGRESGVDVTHILVTNRDASARTVTVSRYDGTTEFQLLVSHPLAAAGTLGSTYLLEMPIRLLRDWSIRMTPSVASQITGHVSFIQPSS